MPIELNRLRSRKTVVWLASEAPEDAQRVFREREYSVESCTSKRLHDPVYLGGISAVVLTEEGETGDGIVKDLRNHAQTLLDFDCNIILRVAPAGIRALVDVVNDLKIPAAGIPLPEAKRLKWQEPEDGDPPTPRVQYFSNAATWASIANFVSEAPPGPVPNLSLDIAIEPVIGANGERDAPVLSDAAKALLQRAFADCSDVHLSRIVRGNSGVDVYRACAELTGGIYGQWPQPHFVKLGRRDKILDEYINYVQHVDPYVPFHLGPHLILDRCCLGAQEGILVGDYVEESEDLCDCAPEGRSAPAIACLFDRTLLGWHRAAHEEATPISQGLLARFPRKINDRRMDKARELGATADLTALRGLFQRCTSTPVLVGPVHGDLHSGNVRVRATDAIVIDFLQHCDYPLVFDAACLEASLLVEGFANDKRRPREWMESLKALYEGVLLRETVSQASPKNPSFWFHGSVHQIRRYARQWECKPNQYAACLALAMLIKAVKNRDAPEQESYRRAGAYVIAERILLSAFGSGQEPAVQAPEDPAPAAVS